jgi:hypothetical protein
MSKSYSGGCACGAVRYEIEDEPMVMGDCQCITCQKKSGTGHGSYLTFPNREKVRVTGKATLWDVAADSGNVKTHGFCPVCGSPVYLTFKAMPALFTVHAASLDDPTRYRPQMVIYTLRGHGWDHVDPALARFDKMPPM